ARDASSYLDMTAGIAVNSLGHGDPDWVNAVVEQAHAYPCQQRLLLNASGHLMTIAEPLAGGLLISVVPTTERVAAAISAGDHNRKEHYWKELVVNKLGGNLRVKEVGGFGLIVGIELDVQASPLVDARRNASLLVLTAERS
ncbi:hypothetical protein BHE74_00021699, partial [Ensete ventricosum]